MNMFFGNPTRPWHKDHRAELFRADSFSLSMRLAIEEGPPRTARGSPQASIG